MQGSNGFHLAVKNGKLDCIKYLLDNCDINVNDTVLSTGDTAVHCLLSENNEVKNLKSLKLLLDQGADHNRLVKLFFVHIQLPAI